MSHVPTPPKPDVPGEHVSKATPAVKQKEKQSSDKPVNWFHRNRTTLIVLASSLVLMIVAGFITWNMYNKSQEPQERLRSSTTYEMLSTVLAKETAQEPASILVAPAEEKWWDYLTENNMNRQAADIEYATIAQKATYFAYTISSGEDFRGHQMAGLPTTFIVYETTDDAVAASSVLNNDGVLNFVRGNMLLLLVPGALTDVDYSLNQFVRSEQVITAEDIDLNGEAILMMNFSEFQNVYPQGWDNGTFVETFKQAFAMAGVQPEGSGWAGSSADGLTWQGRLFGFVPQSELLTDPTSLHRFLETTTEYTLPDGTVTTEPPEEFSGVITARQASARSTFNVATADAVSVGMTDFETGTLMEVETLRERGTSDLLEVTVNVNEWLGYMEGYNTAVYILPVELAVFTLHDAGGNSTLQFMDMPERTNVIPPDATEQPSVPEAPAPTSETEE